MKLIQAVLSILLVLSITGCNSLAKQNEKDISKWMIPVNLALGYFGAIGLHEGGHAITTIALGWKNTRVSVLPTKDDDGNQHYGYTTTRFDKEPTDLELTLFHVMGPTAMWVGHMGARSLLRSGRVPRVMQPTLAWFGLMNQLGYYAGTIYGLARLDHTDLGKEDVWISIVILAGGLSIDLIDFLTDDFEKYFGVLFGEHFYERAKDKNLRLIVTPQEGGGFLGIGFTW